MSDVSSTTTNCMLSLYQMNKLIVALQKFKDEQAQANKERQADEQPGAEVEKAASHG